MAKRKGNSYRFWHSPIALLIIFCFFVLFAYNVIGLIEKAKETANKKDLILGKIDNLQKKESSLSQNISKLKTDEGQEEIIREKYQVAKEGEKMVVIIDDDRTNLQIEKDKNTTHGFINWIENVFKK